MSSSDKLSESGMQAFGSCVETGGETGASCHMGWISETSLAGVLYVGLKHIII